ncbi:transferase [Streptomyces flavidovirens]|uniref:transferase n=1 Tax=Streptomyces flavidovirens TaxID=67298 RepID=UPI0036A729F5
MTAIVTAGGTPMDNQQTTGEPAMVKIVMGDYVSSPRLGALATTPYGALGHFELSEFLATWEVLHGQALNGLPERIHPTAQIHPTAIIGDDVIVGPNVRVHEFSTVRKGSVLCAGSSVGFGCEVTRTLIGEGSILGHQVGIGRSIVGANVHVSASVVVAAISLWNFDMRVPRKEIVMRAPDGERYECLVSQFGALLGDGVQTGSQITLGPGVAVGRQRSSLVAW